MMAFQHVLQPSFDAKKWWFFKPAKRLKKWDLGG
jgi:hypothetical protein